MLVPESLVTALEPWATMYGDSTALSVALTFAHLGSMMVGGGLAIAADRTVLRAGQPTSGDGRRALAAAFADVHRPVVAMLVVSLISGTLQLAADIETFANSTVMWVKVGLLVLLAVNGLVMRSNERSIVAHPEEAKWVGALRLRAMTSIVLWLAITLAGVGLMQG